MVRHVPKCDPRPSRGDLLPLEQQRAAGCCAAAQLDVTSCVELEREEYRQLQLAGDASALGPCVSGAATSLRLPYDCHTTATAFTSYSHNKRLRTARALRTILDFGPPPVRHLGTTDCAIRA